MNILKRAGQPKYFRHGDVHLVRVDSIPKGVVEEKTVEVEKGEMTGHAHRLMFRHDDKHGGQIESAKILKGLDGARFLKVTEPTDLAHEEHHTRTIPPGDYEIRRTLETDHMAGVTRQVAD